MRPFGSAIELEQRRLLAVRLLSEGMSSAEVARSVRVDPRSVRRWWAAARSSGKLGLTARPVRGRPRRLRGSDLVRLHWLLMDGAQASGAPDGAWSCAAVAGLIQRQFGVRYHPAHVNRILHKLGIALRKRRR